MTINADQKVSLLFALIGSSKSFIGCTSGKHLKRKSLVNGKSCCAFPHQILIWKSNDTHKLVLSQSYAIDRLNLFFMRK